MFSYIVGTIEYKGDNLLILDNNNIGYELTISNNTLMSLPNLGESIKIHTYVHFKEDGISIYGFENLDEKEMFLKLINISGVGPKAAISILSGLTPSALSIAIIKQDDKSIASIKGIGKKTAERIVLELKDKVNVAGEIANVQIEKDIHRWELVLCLNGRTSLKGKKELSEKEISDLKEVLKAVSYELRRIGIVLVAHG